MGALHVVCRANLLRNHPKPSDAFHCPSFSKMLSLRCCFGTRPLLYTCHVMHTALSHCPRRACAAISARFPFEVNSSHSLALPHPCTCVNSLALRRRFGAPARAAIPARLRCPFGAPSRQRYMSHSCCLLGALVRARSRCRSGALALSLQRYKEITCTDGAAFSARLCFGAPARAAIQVCLRCLFGALVRLPCCLLGSPAARLLPQSMWPSVAEPPSENDRDNASCGR